MSDEITARAQAAGKENHLMRPSGKAAGTVVRGEARMCNPNENPGSWLSALYVSIQDAGGVPEDWGSHTMPVPVLVVPLVGGQTHLTMEAYLSHQMLLAQQMLRDQLRDSRSLEVQLKEAQASVVSYLDAMVELRRILTADYLDEDGFTDAVDGWLKQWSETMDAHCTQMLGQPRTAGEGARL